MIALSQLRKKEPSSNEPFRVPLYPLFPLAALAIAVFHRGDDVYNPLLALLYLGAISLPDLSN